jgi:hypothetical protein
MTFFSRKKILIQAVTFFPSFILITFAALFSFKLWNNVIASPSTPPSTPPVISPETPPGYILGSPYPDKPSGVYYSSIRTYLNMFSGTFHRFYTTNGDDPDSLSTEFTLLKIQAFKPISIDAQYKNKCTKKQSFGLKLFAVL